MDKHYYEKAQHWYPDTFLPGYNGYAPVTVMAGGGAGAPVPEPITMVSAFMAISGLGMYIRKRTKATA